MSSYIWNWGINDWSYLPSPGWWPISNHLVLFGELFNVTINPIIHLDLSCQLFNLIVFHLLWKLPKKHSSKKQPQPLLSNLPGSPRASWIRARQPRHQFASNKYFQHPASLIKKNSFNWTSDLNIPTPKGRIQFPFCELPQFQSVLLKHLCLLSLSVRGP